ncbi:MAG: hypothetical protein VX248_13400 [Pseudomonadota bacterium]|jgi:hypothetical protein|uniref:Uncharacterized protein n=1 Tax=Thalassococcus halodurans TaxID=373675 RepID=A0A1H5WT55_9RHOB|nr:hypothetical protein [Thalassococcus halodurans]MEE3360937.1 hypothetical protein [Pseudomonadota bacterium]SEG02624.1 hypothetical protein SAMN04488045_1579 [Thalassococcus halodurans]
MHISRRRDFGLIKAAILVALMVVGQMLSGSIAGADNASVAFLDAFKLC